MQTHAATRWDSDHLHLGINNIAGNIVSFLMRGETSCLENRQYGLCVNMGGYMGAGGQQTAYRRGGEERREDR